MNKILINEIWLFIAKNPLKTIDEIREKLIIDDLTKILNILLEKKLIIREDQKFKLPNKYDEKQYLNALLININSSLLENYVKVESEDKNKVIKYFLTPKIEEKKQEIQKKNKKDIFEKNWLFILNDLKKIKRKYENNPDLTEELEILKKIKAELELRFRLNFKNGKN